MLSCRKKLNEVGCLVLRTEPGKTLTQLKRRLLDEIKSDELQLNTISRPSAYGEYEPYHFMDTEEELLRRAKERYCS